MTDASLAQPASAEEAKRAIVAQLQRHLVGTDDYYMIRRLSRPYTAESGIAGVTRTAEQVAWLEAARKDLAKELDRWLATL